MTYNQFIKQVRPLLYVEADNPSTAIQELIDQSVRSWSASMQGLIARYRDNNVDTYTATDFTLDCKASKATFPSNCDLNEIEILIPKEDEEATCQLERKDPTYYPWSLRNKLIEGHPDTPCYTVSVSPHITEFYVYPEVETGTLVKVYWSGMKTDYSAEDEVPWDVDAVDCCAAFVNARLAMTRDDKMNRAQVFLQAYEQGKRRVYLNEQRRSDVKYSN